MMLMTLAGLSLLATGAIFGFFYAWVCSTMWGLDAAPPQVAIQAMQAMNGSVRNAVFAPAFFGTPLILLATSGLALAGGAGRAGLLFGLAAAVYVLGAFLPTMLVNVPMNQALAQAGLPGDSAAAQAIWQDYSPRWQWWNQVRTIASGVSLLLTGAGIWALAARGAARLLPGAA